MNTRQKGFGIIEILIAIVAIVIIGAVIWLLLQNVGVKQEETQVITEKPQALPVAPKVSD